jgi:putative membrane protein
MSYEPISSPAILVPSPLPSRTNAQDIAFLQGASQSNALEIVEGNLAQGKATNPATQQFASWMVADHSSAAPTLNLIAQDLGVALPTSFTSVQTGEVNTLATTAGPLFDANYAIDEVAGHQQTLALFRQEVASGQNSAVVSFARQLIPTLEAHLAAAEQLVGTTTGINLPIDTVTQPTPLPASGPAVGTPNAQDVAFAQTAAIGNLAEIAQSQFATSQSGNAAATQFANWMIADHSGAQASLRTLAGQEGISLPSGLDTANQQLLSQQQSLTDGAFFAVYVTGQILSHTQSLTAFIQEAQYGQDPAIRAYASAGIPTLETHLAAALRLEQTTPGASAAAPAIDQSLTSLLNTAAATGNASLLRGLQQTAAIQPGFTYTPPTAAAAAGLPDSAVAVTMVATPH